MIDKKFFSEIRKSILGYSAQRRELIKAASDAQHLAKKAIFAMQRDNFELAEQCLSNAEKTLEDLAAKYKKETGIFEEGAFKAAQEEFAEAAIFYQFHQKKTIGKLPKIKIDSDIYISGLCDVPGELLRYAVKSATERKYDEVNRCHRAAEDIIAELVDMDLTGYNRQKFDQAKQALHKLEQVVYEISLKS